MLSWMLIKSKIFKKTSKKIILLWFDSISQASAFTVFVIVRVLRNRKEETWIFKTIVDLLAYLKRIFNVVAQVWTFTSYTT